MIPMFPPSPPTQRTEAYRCRGFAGADGPDVLRPTYGMIAGADIRGYFDGPRFPSSGEQFRGQATKDG